MIRNKKLIKISTAILASAAVFTLFTACPQPDTTPITDGMVEGYQKISATKGNFGGTLGADDRFGTSVTTLGDLDGDGVPELAVGAFLDDDGDTDRGAVWVLFLRSDGTVKGRQKLSSEKGDFTGTLGNEDQFGTSVASIGDLDEDGIPDLAVGAEEDDDGAVDAGAVWVLFLNRDGSVKTHQKISDTEGGFGGTLDEDDKFGRSVSTPGDLDGNGIPDLVVGAYEDDDGADEAGAVWVLFLAEAETE